MNVISRRDASRVGSKKFFTGKPCLHGHVSERYVTTGACIECLRGTAPDTIRISLNVHIRDREAIEMFAHHLGLERVRALQTQEGRDEEAYWQLIANYRKLGCPPAQLPRTLGSFTLPEGIDP